MIFKKNTNNISVFFFVLKTMVAKNEEYSTELVFRRG